MLEFPDFTNTIENLANEIHGEIEVTDLVISYINFILIEICKFLLQGRKTSTIRHKKLSVDHIKASVKKLLSHKQKVWCLSQMDEIVSNTEISIYKEWVELTFFPVNAGVHCWKKITDEPSVVSIMICLEFVCSEVLQTAGDMHILNAVENIDKHQVDDVIDSLFPSWKVCLKLEDFSEEAELEKDSSRYTRFRTVSIRSPKSAAAIATPSLPSLTGRRRPSLPTLYSTSERRPSVTIQLPQSPQLSHVHSNGVQSNRDSLDSENSKRLMKIKTYSHSEDEAGEETDVCDLNFFEKVKLNGSPSLMKKKSVSTDCLQSFESSNETIVSVFLPFSMRVKVQIDSKKINYKELLEKIVVPAKCLKLEIFKFYNSKTDKVMEWDSYVTGTLVLEIVDIEESDLLPMLNDMLIFEVLDFDGNVELELRKVKSKIEYKSGKSDALIRRLASEYPVDLTYFDTMALTYRIFSTATDVFEILFKQYTITLPENSSNEDKDYYARFKSRIQMKVIKYFHHWVSEYFIDFKESQKLLNDVIRFCEILENDKYFDYAQDLNEVLHTELEQLEKAHQRKKSEELSKSPMSPKPFSINNASVFLTMDIQELAEELTMIDWELFKAVDSTEFVNNLWNNKSKNLYSNLIRLTEKINECTFWVATEVCTEKDFQKRVKIITQVIKLAGILHEMNNFLTLWGVLGGLGMLGIKELSKTWEGLNPKVLEDYKNLEEFLDPTRNMKNYRQNLELSNLPLMPFIPVCVKDLFMLNESSPTYTEGRVNFDKLTQVSAVIKEIKSYQSTPYTFEVSNRKREVLVKSRKNVINSSMRIKRAALALQENDKRSKLSSTLKRKISRKHQKQMII